MIKFIKRVLQKMCPHPIGMVATVSKYCKIHTSTVVVTKTTCSLCGKLLKKELKA